MPEPTKCPQCGRPVLSKKVDACLYCGAYLLPDQEEKEGRGVVRMEEALQTPVEGKGYVPRGIWGSLFEWGFLKYVLFGLLLGAAIFTAVLWTMKSVRKMNERQVSLAEDAFRRAEEAQRQSFQRQMDVRRNVMEAEGRGSPATSAKQLELARSNLEAIRDALNAYGERNGHFPETLTPDAYEIAWLAKKPFDVSFFLNRRIQSYRRFSPSDTVEAFELVAIAGDGRNTELRVNGSLRLKPR